jgi:mannose-6-phosphate isomerase-like protein (cupin superfamily)
MTGTRRHEPPGIHPPGFIDHLVRRTVRSQAMTEHSTGQNDPRTAGPVDLPSAYASFATEIWAPRIAATVNDYDVKIANGDGGYVWHSHPDTDEFFLVIEGELTIEIEGRDPVVLGPLQLFTVPRGVRHNPSAAPGTRVLFFEPHGTVNSGDADVSGDPWVVPTAGFALGGGPQAD